MQMETDLCMLRYAVWKDPEYGAWMAVPPPRLAFRAQVDSIYGSNTNGSRLSVFRLQLQRWVHDETQKEELFFTDLNEAEKLGREWFNALEGEYIGRITSTIYK